MENESGATLAGDLLRGVLAIAAFIDESPRRTNYLCERGYIPVGKQGANWIASKRVLREHYARLTAGEAA
jgi:hypothetical protein